MAYPEMTPKQIAAAWALVNAAMKGPWFAESGHEQGNGQLYWQVTDATDAIMQNQFCWCQGDHAANAAFIAASRELFPQLLTALEAEQANVARLVGTAERSMRALKPFADRVFDDNGDLTVSDTHMLVSVDYWNAKSAHQVARALLTEIKETDHV